MKFILLGFTQDALENLALIYNDLVRIKAITGKLFCFGIGYTGEALACALIADGWQVAGTCRTQETAALLQAQGIDAVVFDRDQPLDNLAALLEGVTHVLASIPPDASGDPVLDCHARDLQSLGHLPAQILLGSYGQATAKDAQHQPGGLHRALNMLRKNTLRPEKTQFKLAVVNDQLIAPQGCEHLPGHRLHIQHGAGVSTPVNLQ